jgi:phosphoribosylaminoimidazole-succinocarboxamide synthase
LGKREICGVTLPEGMIENQKFEHPIFTPTTKADFGHDQDISKENIIKQNIVTEIELDNIYKTALKLFEFGTEHAKKQSLILVDTKYEFGKLNDELCLMDEIHTPDSSRYFYADGFEERQRNGESQQQLSKEFVREWLIQHDFMGKEGQTVPEMNEVWIETISKRYIELYENIIGEPFEPKHNSDEEVYALIETALLQYNPVS